MPYLYRTGILFFKLNNGKYALKIIIFIIYIYLFTPCRSDLRGGQDIQLNRTEFINLSDNKVNQQF